MSQSNLAMIIWQEILTQFFYKNVAETFLILLKAVYHTVIVHNFNLQEKTTSTFEVTTNLVKKFKAHFEKKLLY